MQHVHKLEKTEKETTYALKYGLFTGTKENHKHEDKASNQEKSRPVYRVPSLKVNVL
jgi:hypothetical protein